MCSIRGVSACPLTAPAKQNVLVALMSLHLDPNRPKGSVVAGQSSYTVLLLNEHVHRLRIDTATWLVHLLLPQRGGSCRRAVGRLLEAVLRRHLWAHAPSWLLMYFNFKD